MRFYKIVIRLPDGTLVRPKSMEGLGLKDASYSSLTSAGSPISSALDVFLDLPVFSASAPRQGAVVRLSGISVADIAQYNVLVGCSIDVFGGMLDGYLPLSKHFKPDLLISGLVWQTAGNWEPNNTTLTLIITAGGQALDPKLAAAGAKANAVLNWPLGDKLEPHLREFLTNVYGKTASNPNGFEIKIAISDQLVARSAQPGGPYKTLTEFGTALKNYTRDSFPFITRQDGAKYDGVEINFPAKGVMYCSDGTQSGGITGLHPRDNPLPIKFEELIGQPVWKTQNTMVFKTIMRGDMVIGDYIKLPSNLQTPYVLTAISGGTQQAPNTPTGVDLSASKNALAFSGPFTVQEIRHVGQFRQPQGQGWVTVIDCLSLFNPKGANTPLSQTEGAAGAPATEPPPGTINPVDPLRSAVPPAPVQGPPPVFPPR